MKKTNQLIVAVLVFLSTLISVYFIVEKNRLRTPDSPTYIYSH